MFADLKSVRVAALVGALVVLASQSLRGQIITDDFDDGNDDGWTRLIPLSEQGLGGTATFSFPGGNTYRIQSAASPNPGVAGPARAGAMRTDQSYSAFRIEVDIVDWDPALNEDIGILARISAPGLGTLNSYAWAYETGADPPEIFLSRVDGEQPSVIASAEITLNQGQSYRFVFEGFQDQLKGQVFPANDPDNALVTVFAFDPIHLEGFGGIFNNSVPDAGVTDTTFDNYRSSTVTDVDDDGMTDQWEWDHFGALFWWADDDNDGDGQLNLDEFIGGSDPTDAGSLSGITSVRLVNNEVVVTFPRVDNRSYLLETSSDLENWDEQPAAVFTDNGDTATLTLPTNGQTPFFVRVRVTVE